MMRFYSTYLPSLIVSILTTFGYNLAFVLGVRKKEKQQAYPDTYTKQVIFSQLSIYLSALLKD